MMFSMWNALIGIEQLLITWSWEWLLNIVISYLFPVPVPTYILGPSSPEEVALYSDISGCEICPNVSYLGKPVI